MRSLPTYVLGPGASQAAELDPGLYIWLGPARRDGSRVARAQWVAHPAAAVRFPLRAIRDATGVRRSEPGDRLEIGDLRLRVVEFDVLRREAIVVLDRRIPRIVHGAAGLARLVGLRIILTLEVWNLAERPSDFHAIGWRDVRAFRAALRAWQRVRRREG